MRVLLSLFFLLLFTSQANAAHLVGGEVSYTYLGGDQYRFVFTLYRDSSSTGSALSNTIQYTVFNPDNTVYNQYITDPLQANFLVNPPDPCLIPPDGIGVQRGVYVDTITLPSTPGGYYVSYQRCCWSAIIDNMTNSDNFGLLIRCDVPGTNLVSVPNNSPVILNLPPYILCTANEVVFDHSAVEPDGDSLVYSICAPDLMDQTLGFDPNPENAGPYGPITWAPGYTSATQFGATSPMTINSATGLLTFTPNVTGSFLTGICIQEYRNGVLINSTNRTYNFTVVNCNQIIPFTFAQFTTGASTDFLVEDCGFQYYAFNRIDSIGDLSFTINVAGTATNGVDYTNIPTTFTIPSGVFSDTLVVGAFYDSFIEANETVTLTFKYFDICSGEFDSLISTFNIRDYQYMTIATPVDSINVCPDLGESAKVFANLASGQPPYIYDWISGQNETYPNSSTITVPPNYITELTNAYYVYVVDACFKTITSDTIWVHNQCPVSFANVYSPNGDGVNDIFLIPNIDDYEAVKLTIFNRWGNVIYQDDDYSNNWDLTTYTGTTLTEGVYFYTAEVINSTKYIYDDQKETEFQAQGFFHVVK
jgi:gliding motility-associated-like protein